MNTDVAVYWFFKFSLFRLVILSLQQIQYGRRSLQRLRRLKARRPACLPSQTGLRRHGNMLWRSFYWDSAGRRSTASAVSVFGYLFLTDILPSLRTCSMQQCAEQLSFALLFTLIYFMCVCLKVFVCSTKWTSSSITSFSEEQLMNQIFILVPQFHFSQFTGTYINCCGFMLPHAERKFRIWYKFATPQLSIPWKPKQKCLYK